MSDETSIPAEQAVVLWNGAYPNGDYATPCDVLVMEHWTPDWRGERDYGEMTYGRGSKRYFDSWLPASYEEMSPEYMLMCVLWSGVPFGRALAEFSKVAEWDWARRLLAAYQDFSPNHWEPGDGKEIARKVARDRAREAIPNLDLETAGDWDERL